MAKRILNKASSESGPEFIIPKMNSDAEPLMDTNVTRRSQSSSKAEQRPVESGKEEIGSSLQRIASGMLKVESASVSMQEVIHTGFKEVGDRTVPGDFEDLMEMVVLKKDFKNSLVGR